jgi:oligoribonuclease NrnB/cAMP/cGMP phosphodiesterase (DHH superfamily)
MIVHNDLDGTVSAAVYARIVKALPSTVIFTEPNQLGNILHKIDKNFSTIIIADLGINEGTIKTIVKELRKLTSSGIKIEWYDHHIWKEEWKKTLMSIGVEINHDITTCGAGVIYKTKYKNKDEISEALVRADCSVDLWLHNDVLGEKLRRIVELDKSFEWKNYLIKKFFKGILWDTEFEKKLEDIMNEELKNYNNILKNVKVIQYDNKRIAIAYRWKGRPDISYGAQYIMSRTDSIIFISANGKYVSFRSNNYIVRDYAVKLGGGGHLKAAGAPLKVPIIYRILIKLGWKSPFFNYIIKKIDPIIREVGIKEFEGRNN